MTLEDYVYINSKLESHNASQVRQLASRNIEVPQFEPWTKDYCKLIVSSYSDSLLLDAISVMDLPYCYWTRQYRSALKEVFDSRFFEKYFLEET